MTKERYIVEDCFVLKPKDALSGTKIDKIIGRRTNNRPSELDIWFEEDSNDTNLIYVSVNGQEPQKLVLEYIYITYGEVVYFNCVCGRRMAKLYLIPNSNEFKCRICHKLKYRSSLINSKSISGSAIHKFARINKIMEMRESISRIFYNGHFTKRYNRFLGLCDKAGLNDVIDGAQNLLKVVKSQ